MSSSLEIIKDEAILGSCIHGQAILLDLAGGSQVIAHTLNSLEGCAKWFRSLVAEIIDCLTKTAVFH